MADAQTPTLEDLRNLSQPAWLWDWQAQRVVWANSAGLTYFGCETLFDLIDRPFDLAESGVGQIVDIGRTLRRGQKARARLFFPSTERAAGIEADCHVHALPDGRPGLLAVANGRGDVAHDGTLAHGFEALPGAAFILSKDGSVVHANAAASRLLGAHAGAAARELLEKAELAGTVSAVRTVETALGVRDIRLTVRLLPEGQTAYAVALADDVTARRALEKQLAPAQPAAAPVETGLSAAEADAFTALGQVLRSETAPSDRPRRKDEVPDFIRKALDAMPGANLFVQNGRLDHASPAAVTLLGHGDAEEALGDQALAAALKALSPDAAAAELPGADGVLRGFSLTSAQIPWRDGPAVRLTLTPMPAAAAPAPPETPAPPAEIEVLPAPAAEPLVADAELRAILDTASDGLIMLDGEGRIMSLSAGAEALFGYRSAEVRQKPFAELMTPESRHTVREYVAALQGPGLASVFNDGREVVAVVSQGGEVPLFLTIGKLEPDKPGKAALCAVVRDITQWKKTEAELRLARDEAERQSRLKSEFLANVSHELRTPLNAILGFSEVMRLQSFGAIGNEKYRSYVNDIHASGAYLLALINDLLDLSKVEAGKLELNFTAVNLAEVAEHAFTLVQEQAAAGRVLLRRSFPPDLPNVVADLRAMRQILINLLSNAVKFTDPGGQVIVSATVSPAGELTLKVKDTGVGMSAEALAQALEPFRRVETAGRRVEGTGLGLPLTKALAEANRSRFAIESAPGQGTTVAITFPTTRVLAM